MWRLSEYNKKLDDWWMMARQSVDALYLLQNAQDNLFSLQQRCAEAGKDDLAKKAEELGESLADPIMKAVGFTSVVIEEMGE